MKHLRKVILTIFLITCFLAVSSNALAQSFGKDISINPNSVRLSTDRVLEGNAVRIYATITNNSGYDLRGNVQFQDQTAGKQIGSDQTVSILANGSDDVFVDWIPYFEGIHHIQLSIDPWESSGDNPDNNYGSISANVLKDTDWDGIVDEEDTDDDNDGVLDEEDHFPLDSKEQIDTDGDRIGNNADEDDDNDSHLDEKDAFPLDSMEWDDTDGDGIGDNTDDDNDNDGLSNNDEEKLGTDPKNPDHDGDTVLDGDDAFPLDQSEQYDYDKDGIGDNKDNDDDDDGVLDEDDIDDHNKGPIIKIDGNTTFAFLNREIYLSAVNSFDEDGEISAYKWYVNGDEPIEGEELSMVVKESNPQNIKLVLTDDKNETRERYVELSVIDLDFYLISFLLLIIIFLAIIINIKYSSWAKKLLKKLKK
jgi:hypothetical protein